MTNYDRILKLVEGSLGGSALVVVFALARLGIEKVGKLGSRGSPLYARVPLGEHNA